MKQNDRMCRFLKRGAVALITGILAIGLMGCSLEDIFNPRSFGDVPFEDDHTTPTDMGVVDDRPGIPEDADFDDLRSDPV